MALIRLAGAILLGFVVTWIWTLWRGLFDNLYVASALFCAICLLIAWICDRMGLERQASPETTELDPPR